MADQNHIAPWISEEEKERSVAKHAVQQHGSEETYLREVNDAHRAICNEEFKNNKSSNCREICRNTLSASARRRQLGIQNHF